MTPRHVIRDIIASLVGLVIFMIAFGSLYTVKQEIPDYATVYADPEKKVYYAPPYVDKLMANPESKPDNPVDVDKLKAMPLKEALALNYTPDKNSEEEGYFIQRYRDLKGYLLEKAGLTNPLQKRWNKDGSWNW